MPGSESDSIRTFDHSTGTETAIMQEARARATSQGDQIVNPIPPLPGDNAVAAIVDAPKSAPRLNNQISPLVLSLFTLFSRWASDNGIDLSVLTSSLARPVEAGSINGDKPTRGELGTYMWVVGNESLPVVPSSSPAPGSYNAPEYTAFVLNHIVQSPGDEGLLWSILDSGGRASFLSTNLQSDSLMAYLDQSTFSYFGGQVDSPCRQRL